MKPPHVLVTGFSAFPGAPVNPTEALMQMLAARSGRFSALCSLSTEVFDVEYHSLPARLDAVGRALKPDIAIHFGLSLSARGFTLERLARNEIVAGQPDNAGFQPPDRTIVPGARDYPTRLPLEDLHAALQAAKLPVHFSDNAGGYLCNYLFYHACGGLCEGYSPAMTGFIHVPPVGEDPCPWPLTIGQLVRGASIMIDVCARKWMDGR